VLKEKKYLSIRWFVVWVSYAYWCLVLDTETHNLWGMAALRTNIFNSL